MKTRIIPLIVAVLLLSGVTATAGEKVGSQPEHGEKGAAVKVITEWDAGCSGNTRKGWDNMCDAWYDEIRNDDSESSGGHGPRAWWGDSFISPGYIRDAQFCDVNQVSWGTDKVDDEGADEPDALLVGMHGGHFTGTNERWNGSPYVGSSSGTTGDCDISQAHMHLGDYDLEFLHLSSCHSMCRKNWDDWESTFGGVHQINGFHGLMYIWSGYSGRYKDFADDAYDLNIAESWVDNHHSYGVLYAWPDHCPVSMVVGRNSEESAETRLAGSEYDWVYDRPTGTKVYAYDWVGECNPKDENALPSSK